MSVILPSIPFILEHRRRLETYLINDDPNPSAGIVNYASPSKSSTLVYGAHSNHAKTVDEQSAAVAVLG